MEIYLSVKEKEEFHIGKKMTFQYLSAHNYFHAEWPFSKGSKDGKVGEIILYIACMY